MFRLKKKRIYLAKNKSAVEPDPVHLSQKFLKSGDKLKIDEEAGVLRNLAIITKGEATGHFFHIDDVMLNQVKDGINNSEKGIRMRLTHPEYASFFGSGDDVDVIVGRAKDATIEDGTVRGDAYLADYADLSPRGKLRTYLLQVAKEDPEIIGISISFDPDEYDESQSKEGLPAGRIRELMAIDFVGTPGGNPRGMLSQKKETPTIKKETEMDKVLKEYLISVGLKADATDEEAQEFFDQLEGTEKEIAQQLQGPGDGDTGEGDSGEGDKNAEGDKGTETEPKKDEKADEGMSKKQAETIKLKERKRLTALTGIAKQAGFDQQWIATHVEKGTSVDDARKFALDSLTKTNEPPELDGGSRGISVVNRNRETLGPAIRDAILLRAGAHFVEIDPLTDEAVRDERGNVKMRKPHERARQFKGLSLLEMGRAFLVNAGIPGVEMISRTEIAELVLSRRKLERRFGHEALAQSTSDFPYILQDAMNKSLRASYEELPKTWVAWVRKVTNPDFKDIKRCALSEAANLVARTEGGEIRYGTLDESRETYALGEYAGGIKLTRKTIINDDLDAFNRTPQRLAAAAARLEDDLVYAILTANAALADGIALFAGAHNNVVYTAGGAPSVAGLNAGQALLRTQTGIKGVATLNLFAKFIIVPAALEGTTRQLLVSTNDPTATMGHVDNIWKGRLIPVIEPRLDANSVLLWYMVADYNQIDTIELAFLESEQVPQLKQETEFDTGDIKYAIVHTCAAKAIDHRGMVKNHGVAVPTTTAAATTTVAPTTSLS